MQMPVRHVIHALADTQETRESVRSNGEDIAGREPKCRHSQHPRAHQWRDDVAQEIVVRALAGPTERPGKAFRSLSTRKAVQLNFVHAPRDPPSWQRSVTGAVSVTDMRPSRDSMKCTSRRLCETQAELTQLIRR